MAVFNENLVYTEKMEDGRINYYTFKMNCPKCQKIIKEQDKFCPHCGFKFVSPKEEKTSVIPTAQISPTRKQVSFIPLIIIAIVFGVGTYISINMHADPVFSAVFGLVFLVLCFSLFIEFLKVLPKVIKYFIKHPVVAVFTIVGVFVLGIVGFFVNKEFEYKMSRSELVLLQDYLAQASLYKSMGDSIQANRPVPQGWSMAKVESESTNIFSIFHGLSVPDLFTEYHKSINDWTADIAVSAKNTEEWKSISSQPDTFSISLSDSQLTTALDDSIQKIAVLKEFGDSAISKGDRETMRYIAAKLLVQNHWLDNLAVADKPGLFGQNSFTVYAESEDVIARRKPCVKKRGYSVCIEDVRTMGQRVYRSAHNYTIGEPSAPEEWTDAWTEAEPILEIGQPVGGVGITTGETTTTQYSPTVQLFMDECKSKGGTVGGTGGVKTRLPTTEDGYTCWYEDSGKCWDLLTYSGGRYKGGAKNCPEEGLVPEPHQSFFDDVSDFFGSIIPSITPTTTGNSWDGKYSITYQNNGCKVGGVNVPINYTDIAPFSYEFTVKNNKVVFSSGDTFSIDSQGKAQITFDYSESGYTVRYVDTMIFTRSGDVVSVAGGANFGGTGVEYGQRINITCSAKYTGHRV